MAAMCVSYRSAEFRAGVESFLAPHAPRAPPARANAMAQCVAPLRGVAERVDALGVPAWIPELVFGDLNALRSGVKRQGINMEDFV